MDKKTMESLRVMLCEEIESIAKKGNLTHESLDILKDLIETEKNLGKIEENLLYYNLAHFYFLLEVN